MKTTAKMTLKLCFFLLFCVSFAYVFPAGLRPLRLRTQRVRFRARKTIIKEKG